MGTPSGSCPCLAHRPAGPCEAQGSWLGDEAPCEGARSCRCGWAEAEAGELSRRQPAAVGQRWEPARRGNRRDSSPSRVPAAPSRVSLPGVPQNSLSGQLPQPPLSQISPPPPGGRGPGTPLYSLVSLRFLCPFKSRSMVIKERGAAARSSPAGAEGMLTPRRARDAGPPVTSARGSPLPHGTERPSPCWAGRGGAARARAPASFNLPSKASLQGGRECHLREWFFEQHLPCLPPPPAGAAAA